MTDDELTQARNEYATFAFIATIVFVWLGYAWVAAIICTFLSSGWIYAAAIITWLGLTVLGGAAIANGDDVCKYWSSTLAWRNHVRQTKTLEREARAMMAQYSALKKTP